jgi:multiple sugar transport system substrate-binding protein
VGVGGSNAFADQWLDLQPLVDSTGYDLSVFDPALLDLYRTPDGGLVGIPFAVFPAVTYYNRGLFDEAGLNYPPQEFNAPYVMPDGTEVPWNYDTVAELAKILTVDANGNDATMEEFDPENIVQFGLRFQWAGLRLLWTDFQPEDWYDNEANTITIPDSWRAATQWVWDRTWVDHTIPNTTYANSELLGNDNAFNSGNLAMAVVPLWYTCCLGDSVGNWEWDMAVVPQSPDGEHHVAMDADTFRITVGSANPEAAFTVLSYLLDEAVPTLAPTYGAFPARPAYQQAWIDSKNEQYPFDVNWQVAVDSLAFSNPIELHHESDHPNWQKGADRVAAFNTLLFSDTGAEMDVNAELDTLQADLQAIVEE